MDKKEATNIARSIGKMLGYDCEVYDFDDETLYINTCEETLDFQALLAVHDKYVIEAINVDDDCDGMLILQIDLRTQEQRQFDREAGEEL